ncbi:MAG: YjjW family glycine radical enzyme activase [Anaerolineaceae bacterium]|nr:YjjW family glycine radical enzyme activase [Anaerolineaceae bacterium]
MEQKQIGLINKIIPQSFVDGPGNRTAVFLQGCNLHCLFCHNPQTINICSDCGLCVSECPAGALSMENGRVLWLESRCEECLGCEKICPTFSTPRVRPLTAMQLWQEIAPHQAFISGVTLSGGEPLLQPDFVSDFFELVQAAGLNTMVETNGHIAFDVIEKVLPFVDQFMVDLKVFDNDIHQELTSRQNVAIKATIKLLAERKKLYAVRTTVVPGYNDNLENAALTARFLADIDPHIALTFLRFRAHGTRGEALSWASPPEELLEEMTLAASEEGLLNVSRSI